MGCPCGKLRGKHQAQPAAVAPIARDVVEPVRNPAEPGVAPVAAPAKHAIAPGLRSGRIRLRLHTVSPEPVLAPLPHVPAHVVQAQLVRLLLPYRMRMPSAIVSVPSDLVQSVAPRVLVPLALDSSSRRVFPLRLHRQAEVQARPVVQPLDEPLAILPTYIFHRIVSHALSLLGFSPITSLHKPCVTAYFPIWKSDKLTLWTGFSSSQASSPCSAVSHLECPSLHVHHLE